MADTMQIRVLRCLEGGVERTCHDIAGILAVDARNVTARLGELARAKKVERVGTGPRKPGTTGGKQPMLWRLKLPIQEIAP